MSAEPEIALPPPALCSAPSAQRPHVVTADRTSVAGFLLPAAILMLVTLVAYAPVWRAGFIWDDDVLLTGNPAVQAPDGLRTIWRGAQSPDYFPMTSTVLWLEWRLWGANPLGYHLVNVLLHALNALVLWRVLRKIFSSEFRFSSGDTPVIEFETRSWKPELFTAAWLAAAIFALHPVNVESVAWIAELKNTLAMFFFSLTLWAYLRSEESARNSSHAIAWYAGAVIAFVLALLSKTAVVPLPVVLLGLAVWRRGRLTWRDVRRGLPFFTASALLALVTIWFQQHRAIGSMVARDDGFLSRMATAGCAIWFYLYKAILPVNLSLIYPRWRFNGSDALAYLPGLAAVAGLLICWRFRKRWGTPWLFAFGYFVVMLAPVLGFVDISFMRYSLVADRWQYFAILGPIALIAVQLTGSLRPITAVRFGHAPFSVGLLLALGVLTWRQAGNFSDPEMLWTNTLSRNPNCPVAQIELGNIFVGKNRPDEAIPHYAAALRISSDDELARYNLGYALLQQGKIADAIVHLEKAVALQPNYLPAQFNLGNALFQNGQVQEAIGHYEKAVALDPGFADVHNRLGNALLRNDQLPEAIAQFQEALKIRPADPNALNNLGVVMIHQGRSDEAMAMFQRAVELQPNFAEGQNNLGRILLLKGRAREAVTHYRASLKSQPDDPATLSNLAWVLATSSDASLRNGNEALELARRASQVSGGQNPAALRATAAACAETGRFEQAIAHARRAFKLAEARGDEEEMASLRAELNCYEGDAPFRESGGGNK
jgi:tetratricopeptide (TPR) repeat protein